MKGLPFPLPLQPTSQLSQASPGESGPTCSEPFPSLLVLRCGLSSTVVITGEYIVSEGILVLDGRLIRLLSFVPVNQSSALIRV